MEIEIYLMTEKSDNHTQGNNLLIKHRLIYITQTRIYNITFQLYTNYYFQPFYNHTFTPQLQ